MLDVAAIEAVLPKLTPQELRRLAGLCMGLSNRGLNNGNLFGRTPPLLGAMQVGDVRVLERKVHNYDRLKGRRDLGNPDAQWKTLRLANGSTRVTRVR